MADPAGNVRCQGRTGNDLSQPRPAGLIRKTARATVSSSKAALARVVETRP